MSAVVPDIPGSLNKNPERWKRVDVLAFLHANKDEYDLDDKHIEAIRINEVAGRALLRLTRIDLREAPYNLSDGAAIAIEELIKALKTETERKLSEELSKKKEPEPQVEPQAEPQAEQEDISPTHIPHQISRSYRTSSGSTSHSSFQSHRNLDALIHDELNGTVFINVKGFDKFFNHVEELTVDVDSLVSPSLSVWLQQGEKDFEDSGRLWFTTFSEFVRLSLSSGSLGIGQSRFYYGSGGIPLCDAYHQAARKCDIFLQQKLPDPQHKTVIDVAQVSEDPKTPSNPKHQFSWRDVLVVGEFKCNKNTDSSKGILTQLGGYIREVFGAQPGRRFVHAFTVCGSTARLWMFDRAGVSGSEPMDISQEIGRASFLRALMGYMTMSPAALGFDDRYKGSSGETFLPHRDVMHPTFLEVREGKRLELLKILNWSPSIVSRGTLCWRAKDQAGKLCVVKDAWRDQKLPQEAKYWQEAEQKGALGVPEILDALDAEVVSRPMEADADNNIRQKLDFKSAKPVRLFRTAVHSYTKSTNHTALSVIESEPEEIGSDRGTLDGVLSHGAKKRAACGSHNHFSKRPKHDKFVEGRVRSIMVLGTVGKKLNEITSPVEMVEVLRDAVKCHQSLYERAGILHSDISINNIMGRTGGTEKDGLKGFLIDLDYAQKLPQNPITAPNIVTGTPPFMALEILLYPPVVHTWRHDLESFLYVLIWGCIKAPRHKLQTWCSNQRESAENKQNSVSNGFNEVLDLFDAKFEALKSLARGLREILFYASKYCIDRSKMYLATPPGETARRDMYKKFLAEFDVQIDRLNSERERISLAAAPDPTPACTTQAGTETNEQQEIEGSKSAEWVQVGLGKDNVGEE